jgi:hypothetical protein
LSRVNDLPSITRSGDRDKESHLHCIKRLLSLLLSALWRLFVMETPLTSSPVALPRCLLKTEPSEVMFSLVAGREKREIGNRTADFHKIPTVTFLPLHGK